VDNSRRDELFSAADVAILSFATDYPNNSGTLMDAISAGVPVVCSDRSAASEIVGVFGLGAIFRSGDAADLASKVASGDITVSSEDLAAARDALSNRQVAGRMIDAVRSVDL
jgi:glycosyltransferase involved in cell wall biosynthesis